MLPVRTDENVDLGALSIGKVEFDSVVIFAERDKPVANVQSVRPVRCKYTLQIRTMNTEIRRAKSRAVDATPRNRE